MTTTNIPIMRIENNTGQVPGLPPNPRITNRAKLDKLVESIKQDPKCCNCVGCSFIRLRMASISPSGAICVYKPSNGLDLMMSHVSLSPRKRPLKNSFTLNVDIQEHNIIVFDDILTTGATLDAVNKLLPSKNCLNIIGINNN